MAESPQSGVKVVYPVCGKCDGLCMFYVYILKSKSANRFYIGHTNNLKRRLEEHNAGKTSSIKAYIPWEIIYCEEFLTKT